MSPVGRGSCKSGHLDGLGGRWGKSGRRAKQVTLCSGTELGGVTHRAEDGPGRGHGLLQLLARALQTHRPRAAGSSGFSRKLNIWIFTCSLDFKIWPLIKNF